MPLFQNAVLVGQIYIFFRGIIVEKLIEYMSFKTYHESVGGAKEEISVNDFMERIPPEIVLELSVLILPSVKNRNHLFLFLFRLLAADYQESELLIYFFFPFVHMFDITSVTCIS